MDIQINNYTKKLLRDIESDKFEQVIEEPPDFLAFLEEVDLVETEQEFSELLERLDEKLSLKTN